MASPLVIGVTGGIGSGKTTVCDRFNERHGVPVIDADIVAREVVEPGTEGLRELVEAFGTTILSSDGELDRRHLKRIVFATPELRERLEQILHPRIRAAMSSQVAATEAPYLLLSIPLLAEGGDNPLIDRVLVVDCSEETQVARVTARDDLTADEALAIMRAQASRGDRLKIADDVIVNQGSPDALDADIDTLHQRYLTLAARRA